MSIDSPNHPTPELYCSEATNEVIHLDSDEEALKLNNFLWGDCDSDESSLLSLLESEHDQVHEQTESRGQLRKKTWLINAREEAINWILKVHLLASYVQSTKKCMTFHCNQFLIVTFFSICRFMLTTVLDPRQHIFL